MHAIFYRNLNLGQPGSPTRAQLEAAISDAGAQRVKSFQTNGTVLIDSPDPYVVVRRAAVSLREDAGYDDVGIVRPVADLTVLLELGVFPDPAAEDTYRENFTFFIGDPPQWELPWTNRANDVDILYVNDGVALSVIRRRGNSVGAPTREIERATGGRATTRTRGTIERLLKTAAAW